MADRLLVVDELDPQDFRYEAARESLRQIDQQGGAVPEDASLCIPLANPDDRGLRAVGYASGVLALLGLLAVIVGGFLAFFFGMQFGKTGNPLGLVVALSCSLVGTGLLCGTTLLLRQFARRRLGDRYDALREAFPDGPWRCVSLESANTFDKMKIVPEDLGYFAWTEFDRRLVIEGLRYRYVIRGDDVCDIRKIAGAMSTATYIGYRVGEHELEVALESSTSGTELRKAFGGADPLPNLLRDVLLDESDYD